MADIVDPQKRSQMMAGIGAKNTKPEIRVRKILHRLGYRFSLHRKDLPGKPDIILRKWKTVVFVHGCFWHGHEHCPIFRLPKSRTDFWAEKIGANKRRDSKVRGDYETTGWRMVEVWECATKGKLKLNDQQLTASLNIAISGSKQPYVVIRGHTL